ncbi:exosortase-dependent surface protein XDP2 [Anabaena azotica]|uniref:PEP-CTERM sorting domain-containing protein n=1 Tax=Anabaena azotica FACHB-119 TaxID=947527 RepID=A0ABR8D805_9NOST|nr:exosortase-dependent surface protein XDP2 [Anabaena azotica]MBD2502558.1 PEP-CTERM sorting domain-containing protein [Anabaena azotica FACHB-119]
MKFYTILLPTGLAVSTVLAVSHSAQAASFTTNFTPNPADPKKDIFLESITQNGVRLTNFNYVNGANIVRNKGITNRSFGAASTDRGDEATNPDGLSPKENLVAGNAADGKAVATYLGNNNLNNIIDTEDDGFFTLDLTFTDQIVANSNGTDSLFFWERGGNADLVVQALDNSGNLIGRSFRITRNRWTSAGFSIDTTETTGAQPVGSYGVSFADLGLNSSSVISGIRLISESNYRGPDFKVIAASAAVSEPATILGLGSIAALALVRRRQIRKKSLWKSSF